MEDMIYSIGDTEETKPISNDDPKIDIIDSYGCNACSNQVEILAINEEDNTITFKCLNNNEKENHKIQTIPINEYINKMKKNTYLYSKCSICNQRQNEYKDTPIFSYCFMCNKIICSTCVEEHIELNQKIHQNDNKECIIKNDEKVIKCSIHPNEINEK